MSTASILQLNPSIPVLTRDGKGEAVGWIDYTKDDDLLWIVFLQKNGQCWIYPNSAIRALPNITFRRMEGMSEDEVSASIEAGPLPKRKPSPTPPLPVSSSPSPSPRSKSKPHAGSKNGSH